MPDADKWVDDPFFFPGSEMKPLEKSVFALVMIKAKLELFKMPVAWRSLNVTPRQLF